MTTPCGAKRPPGVAARAGFATLAKERKKTGDAASEVSSGRLFRNHVPLNRVLVDRIEIETILNIQPVLRGVTEIPGEPGGSVRGNGAFLIHDQADAACRHADRLCQPVDADPFILQIFEKDPTGVNRWQPLSVVVGDFDIGRSFRSPFEADAVLVVDSNVELAFAVPAQRFQPVAPMYPKVVEGCGGVQPNQAGSGLIFDIHKFSDARSA